MGRVVDSILIRDEKVANIVKESLEKQGYSVNRSYQSSPRPKYRDHGVVKLTVTERGMYETTMAPPAPKRKEYDNRDNPFHPDYEDPSDPFKPRVWK